MSKKLTPIALMEKADQACSSARALLNLGDADGACNRAYYAYYAMFDAACAALLASDVPGVSDIGRTHGGLIREFGNYLIKNGSLPRDIGKFLKRSEEIRLIADYSGDSVELIDAYEIVKQAEVFVETLRRIFTQNHSE